MASVRHGFQKMEEFALLFEGVLGVIVEHEFEALGLADASQQFAFQIRIGAAHQQRLESVVNQITESKHTGRDVFNLPLNIVLL